ncbi:MAG TPA: TlpA disulfide reductase family protein [Anaerolineaceae bacterium]
MKNVIFGILGISTGLVLGWIVLVSGPKDQSKKDFGQIPQIGKQISSLDLYDINGRRFTIQNLRGKAAIINFWATWCPPCREEMPLLQEISEKYSDRIQIFAINNGESKELVIDYVRKNGINFPVLIDEKSVIANKFRIYNLPASYFVDPQGILRSIRVGALTKTNINEYLQTIGILE